MGPAEPGNLAQTLTSYMPALPRWSRGKSAEKWLPLTSTGIGVTKPGGQYIWYGGGTRYERRWFRSWMASGLGVSTRATPMPAKTAGASIVPATCTVLPGGKLCDRGAYLP